MKRAIRAVATAIRLGYPIMIGLVLNACLMAAALSGIVPTRHSMDMAYLGIILMFLAYYWEYAVLKKALCKPDGKATH